MLMSSWCSTYPRHHRAGDTGVIIAYIKIFSLNSDGLLKVVVVAFNGLVISTIEDAKAVELAANVALYL